MTSLGEDFPRQQARCRVVLASYRALGPSGAFGATMIEQSLAAADEAASSGDVIAMIRAYQDLKGIE